MKILSFNDPHVVPNPYVFPPYFTKGDILKKVLVVLFLDVFKLHKEPLKCDKGVVYITHTLYSKSFEAFSEEQIKSYFTSLAQVL